MLNEIVHKRHKADG